MTKEDELQALREENRLLKALVAQLLPLQEQLAQVNARIKELEERLAKDSRTRGQRFLPHPQLSFDHAEARSLHALCSDCCLSWSPFPGRLGT